MVDMNSEMYLCCGITVEISGQKTDMGEGRLGHQIRCHLCKGVFTVEGGLEEARQEIPRHFLDTHKMQGELEDWRP